MSYRIGTAIKAIVHPDVSGFIFGEDKRNFFVLVVFGGQPYNLNYTKAYIAMYWDINVE